MNLRQHFGSNEWLMRPEMSGRRHTVRLSQLVIDLSADVVHDGQEFTLLFLS